MTRTRCEGWLHSVCGRLTALALVALFALGVAGCGDDGNSRLDELPTNDDLTAGQLSAGEFAEVVQIVGDGHVPDSTRRAVAEGLVHYMAEIGDAAATQSDDDFARADIVALAAELGHDEQATQHMVDAGIAWGTERAQMLATDPDTSTETAFGPVAMVTGAMMDGADALDDPALRPADVGSMMVGELRVTLAEAFAAETGDEMPEGIPPAGERWDGHGDWWNETDEVINRATPDGMTNPADQLDQTILDQANNAKYSDPDSDDWQY